MNRLSPHKQAAIIHDLVEGGSLRSAERKHQVSFNTVMKLFEDAGDMAIAYFDGLKDLECARIQADEMHTFVGTRDRFDRLTGEVASGLGTVWVYVAVDADTKMIVDFLPGTREVYDATRFMKSIASKLRRDSFGRFAVRPTIVTDGLPACKEATAIAFGTDADVGMMIKKYSDVGKKGQKLSRERYIGADRVTLIGSPKYEDIHTSYIERTNLNLRMDIKRLGRKSNAFSKKLLNLKRHLALWALYFNFCRVHKALRMPPAMAAGLSDHIWEVDEIVQRTSEFLAERLRNQVANDDPAEEVSSDAIPTHWVYRSTLHYLAKVHAADCYHCKHGEGQRRGNQKAGEWLPFYSQESAMVAAAALEPDRHAVCNVCIGSYRNAGGYRGPRR
ncbi:hypothetical protein LVY65_05625 [Sphingomonas sp. G124]|uniref:Transposase n=1 Tax=Sphingomonas cremea TaxID=2904799 RepID=A0A9X1QJH5_9SPHN|nr:IS1 family transposase [Sphingomonas cremea]MCF2514545.1 hypothetical protein [Sphingomonas cremea]